LSLDESASASSLKIPKKFHSELTLDSSPTKKQKLSRKSATNMPSAASALDGLLRISAGDQGDSDLMRWNICGLYVKVLKSS